MNEEIMSRLQTAMLDCLEREFGSVAYIERNDLEFQFHIASDGLLFCIDDPSKNVTYQYFLNKSDMRFEIDKIE